MANKTDIKIPVIESKTSVSLYPCESGLSSKNNVKIISIVYNVEIDIDDAIKLREKINKFISREIEKCINKKM